jgi:K(+)-stimulated pyrophosphate-energized sodium pump
MDFLNTYLIYLIPVFGLVGILFMAIKSAWVTKQDAGSGDMTELAGYIADGAMAFLRAEWKILGYFVGLTAILLAWSGYSVENSSPVIAVSFVIGAFLSAFAGYLGMRIATKSNVRTTQAAKTSLAQALKVSFTGGTVMGLGVAGLAIIGLGSLFIVFYTMYVVNTGGNVNGLEMEKALDVLAGFSLGAESIALFARVGGGIYTKAADVGADLVGKVEAGIPEDDVRNPATIADNVGDNVGDVGYHGFRSRNCIKRFNGRHCSGFITNGNCRLRFNILNSRCGFRKDQKRNRQRAKRIEHRQLGIYCINSYSYLLCGSVDVA